MAEFMGEFDEAYHAYAQAQALAPNDNVTRYRVASFATRIGDYDRALRELDAILGTQPKSMQFFFRWAPAFLQKPLLKRSPALEQFVALQIDILMEKGDVAEARRLARRHAIVDSGRDYCAEANAKKTAAARPTRSSRRFAWPCSASRAPPTASGGTASGSPTRATCGSAG